MNTQMVWTCLGIMGSGMLGIFAVILVIWGLVALLNRLTRKKKGEGRGRNTRPRPSRISPRQ